MPNKRQAPEPKTESAPKAAEVVPVENAVATEADAPPTFADSMAIMRTDDFAELNAQLVSILGQSSEFDLKQIRVPPVTTKKWQIPSVAGTKEKLSISGIILYQKMTRGWWEKSFEESGGGAPPDCASIYGDVGYGTLPEDALKVLGQKAEDGEGGGPGFDCSRCPFAKFGSDRRGRAGKDCKEMRPIFVLPLDTFMPIVIRTPPGSLKSAQQWLNSLQSEMIPAHRIVTQFTLEQVPGPPPYNRIKFSIPDEVDGQIEACTIERGSQAEQRILAIKSHVEKAYAESITVEPADFQGESA